jgi:hypothetical protein
LSLDSFYPLIDEPQTQGAVSAAADSDDSDDQGVQDHDEIQNAQWLFNEHWQNIEALLEPAWAHNREEKEKAARNPAVHTDNLAPGVKSVCVW